MESPKQPLPGPPLRIAVLGDFDGLHTRRWLSVFVERGHDVHAISFYAPREPLPGVTMHVLRPRPLPLIPPLRGRRGGGQSRNGGEQIENPLTTDRESSKSRRVKDRLPPSLMRLIHAWRYRRAGLRQTLANIQPDVFQAHFVVEHGFYGAFAGFHPYVVSAWGSDIFVAPEQPAGNLIARYALRHADLVTVNDPAMGLRAVELGVPAERVQIVHLGIDDVFLDAPAGSVNLQDTSTALMVVSDRALEPVYNIDTVLRAFAKLRGQLAEIQLVVANDGSRRDRLEKLARDLGLGEAVHFAGRLEPPELLRALQSAHVYVSIPSSDSLALSTLEAMASGAFPVVSDLPSQDGAIVHGENSLRVPVRDVHALSEALSHALTNAELRRHAVSVNRELARAIGNRYKNMLRVERAFYRLAGHSVNEPQA